MALGSQDMVAERRPDGAVLLRAVRPLAQYPRKLTERLEHWAAQAPERVFVAQRDARGGWRKLIYAQALQQARSIGQYLLEKKLSAERPLVVLSGNDIEHA